MGTLKAEPGQGVCEAGLGIGSRWCPTFSQHPPACSRGWAWWPERGSGLGGQQSTVRAGGADSGPLVHSVLGCLWGETTATQFQGRDCPHFLGEDVAP